MKYNLHNVQIIYLYLNIHVCLSQICWKNMYTHEIGKQMSLKKTTFEIIGRCDEFRL